MSDAILFAICLGVVQALTVVTVAILFGRYVRRKEEEYARRLLEAWKDITESPDENTPSQLAQYADLFATVLAGRLMQQVKTAMAGKLSGQARSEQAEAMGEAMAGLPPWMAVAAALLPKRLTKQLLTNPQMLGAFTKVAGNHSSSPASSQGRFEDVS